MEKEEKINDIYSRIISKLKIELNSEISTLIDIDDIKDRITHVVNGSHEEEEIVFQKVYPYIYSCALQNLTDNVFVDENIFPKKDTCPSSNDNGVTSLNGFSQDVPKSPTKLLENKQTLQSEQSNPNNNDLQFNDATSDLTKMVNIFCSLLPNINKLEIETKLKDNLHISGYKAILLEELIMNHVEEGFDINEEAFSKLEEWQKHIKTKSENLNTNHALNTAESEILTEISQNESESKTSKEESQYKNENDSNKEIVTFDKLFMEQIKFISEIVPNIQEEEIKMKIMNCSNEKEAHKIISDYMKYFNRVCLATDKSHCNTNYSQAGPSNSKQETSEFSILTSGTYCNNDSILNENDKSCIIVSEKKQKSPIIISLDEEVPSPVSDNSDILVVEELHNSLNTEQPPKCIKNNTNNALLPSNTDSQENEFHQSTSSSVQPFVNNAASKQVDIIPDLNTNSKLDSKLVDTNPVPIVPPLKVLHNKNELQEESSDNYLPDNTAEDIYMQEAPWTEAREICFLLPFLQLNDVHQSIIDNYYHPKRKVHVLREYIELALEDGYEVTQEALETISLWQLEKKRILTDKSELISNKNYKKQKSSHHLAPNTIQPLPSTSKEGISNITVDQPLPATSHDLKLVNDLKETLFKSFPEEKKSWYQKKIDFLKELSGSLSEEYILSQITLCRTEADIINLAAQILEKQTNNMLHANSFEDNRIEDNLNSIQNNDSVPTTSAQTEFEEATEESNGAESNRNSMDDIEDKIQAHIQQLREIFNDADPDFLFERLVA